jgi:signal transduction histidine kinase
MTMGAGVRIDHLQERLDALRSLTLRSDIPISTADVDELTSALRRLHEAETELERKRAELDAARAAVEVERQRCREQLADADRARVQFLTTMSHELRTPLNVVLGWTFRLRANELEAEQSAKAVASIDRNARRELRLIEELLDSARIACGQLRLHLDTHELAPLLQPAIDAGAASAAAKAIAISCDLARGVYVRADPERMHQIAWNLLNNAVKFTPKAGTVRVTLSAEPPDAVFAVADSGIGIAPAALARLFEPFWQAEQSTRRGRTGLGLGLPIVKYLVELHGGELSAASQGPKLGSTFTVRLPLADSPVRQ